MAVDENPRLESEEIKVIAIVIFGELADVRVVPAMERDVEGGAGGQSRHKATHGREAVRAGAVGELCQDHE